MVNQQVETEAQAHEAVLKAIAEFHEERRRLGVNPAILNLQRKVERLVGSGGSPRVVQ